jgi:CspA family cold shock protein
MQGRVKWFDTKRGYGFITSSDGVDVYVHYSAVQSEGFKNLKHNWRVEFSVVTTDEGKVEARDVRVLR